MILINPATHNYVVISYYADFNPARSTFYEDCYHKLHSQLVSLSIPFIIDQLPVSGRYMTNCLFKPNFILDKIKALAKPVIWIDVDSHIVKFPYDFADDEYDMSVVIRESCATIKVPESCFIYFNYTSSSIAFIQEWADRCNRATRDLDHLILIDLFNEWNGKHIRAKNYEWYYASTAKSKQVYIKMINSISADKRSTDSSLYKFGRI